MLCMSGYLKTLCNAIAHFFAGAALHNEPAHFNVLGFSEHAV